jgi:hypothetical protein
MTPEGLLCLAQLKFMGRKTNMSDSLDAALCQIQLVNVPRPMTASDS